MELLAYDRVQAIAADQHRAALWFECRAGRGVREVRRRAGAVLIEPRAAPTRENAIAAGALAIRIEQRYLQVAAVYRELRVHVAGLTSQRLAIDELAEAVIEHRLARED